MRPISITSVPKVHIDRNERDERGIPESMLCPISREVMRDPVILRVRDGQDGVKGERYERTAINSWLDTVPLARPLISPSTRRPVLANGRLQPDTFLRQRINRTLKRDPVFLAQLSLAQKTAICRAFAHQIPKHHAAAQILISQVPTDGSAEAFFQDILAHCRPRSRVTPGSPPATRGRVRQDRTVPNATQPARHGPERPERSATPPRFHIYPVDAHFDMRVFPNGGPLTLIDHFGSVQELGRYVHREFSRRGLHTSSEHQEQMQLLAQSESWEDLLSAYHVRFNSIVVPTQRPPRPSR